MAVINHHRVSVSLLFFSSSFSFLYAAWVVHRGANRRWCNNGEVGGVESQQKDKQRNCLKKMRYNSTTNPKWRIDPGDIDVSFVGRPSGTLFSF